MAIPLGELCAGPELAGGPSGNPRIGVIADDMTGAMDCGAQFPPAGWPTRLILDLNDHGRSAAEVVVTETREAEPEQAVRAIHCLLPRLAGRRLFKKIDSTMRGPVAAEIHALLEATGIGVALVCPAIIEEERTVVDGRLHVGGQPLHQTLIPDDAAPPTTSPDIASIMGNDVAKIRLDTVRQGAARVGEEIRQCGMPIVVADACTQHDLDCLARAAVETEALPVGGFGLAKAWASALSYSTATETQAPATISGKLIFLMGSRHPATQRQIQAIRRQIPSCLAEATPQDTARGDALHGRARQVLRQSPFVLLHMPSDMLEPGDARSMLQSMACVACRLCQEFEVAGFFVSGGETAFRLCECLGTRAIEVEGELAPGLPFGILQGGVGEGALLITKAGGFGRERALLETIARLELWKS
jgi:uncharacterized protein YgbK (DUF1537 family)